MFRSSKSGGTASSAGSARVAVDHFNSADDEDFARIAAIEKRIAFAEGDFRLIDFDDPLQWFAYVT